MKTLFIILARGGSKGLPGKNIRNLLGKPLIAHSIELGLSSVYCTDLIVSTDDARIAEIAKEFGAQVPFIRPAELANDNAKSAEAIIHAIEYQEKKGKSYENILLLEPTSPLKDTSDIDHAIEVFNTQEKALSCVSITLTESAHPTFLFHKDGQGNLKSYQKTENVTRRQDLNELYYPQGSFYLAKTKVYLEKKTFYIDNFTLGIEMPKWKSFEIDTLEDFIIVESIMQSKLAGKFNFIK
jgi:CMP-N,N'-diacetyllegionaminic acid synthase